MEKKVATSFTLPMGLILELENYARERSIKLSPAVADLLSAALKYEPPKPLVNGDDKEALEAQQQLFILKAGELEDKLKKLREKKKKELDEWVTIADDHAGERDQKATFK